MWPFKKPVPDSIKTGIVLDDNYTLPLTMDNEEYRKGLETMKRILANWIRQDFAALALMRQSPSTDSLVHAFRNTDLKFLPYPLMQEQLEVALEDKEGFSMSGSRFFDAIGLIHSEVPVECIETFKGKFLHGMLYGLPATINGNPLPSKEAWVRLLARHPWVPFIQLVQEIFEEEISPKVTGTQTQEPS